MQKFPSVDQFRHAVRAVRDSNAFFYAQPSIIDFVGTVKLHGTNAGVTWEPGKPLTYQSRNRVLAVGDDNAGFAAHMSQPRSDFWLRLAIANIALCNGIEPGHTVQVFGEWCGEGIQKGIAISALPKMYVIFAACSGGRWLDISQMDDSYRDGSICSIYHFPTFRITIDFATPEIAQNEMVGMTLAVEAECPVGKAFGVSGIGEGIVWRPASYDETIGNVPNDSRLWFKVKGEKHSSSRVATLAAVDVERIANRDELIAALVTDNRMAQALDHFLNQNKLELKINNIGSYLRWVFNDIAKEETDTIEASGFTVKELGKPISDVAKRYFMIALNETAFCAAQAA